MSWFEILCVILGFFCVRDAILVIFLPNNVIEHRHEDDPFLELLWWDVFVLHVFLNLLKNCQCCESWDFFHSNSDVSPSIPTAS